MDNRETTPTPHPQESEAPATPKNTRPGPTIQSTPQSQTMGSHVESLVERDNVLRKEMDDKLAADIQSRQTRSIDTWASVVLGLNLQDDLEDLSETVDNLMQAYLDATEGSVGNEPGIYGSLLALLNAALGSDSELIAYQQHPNPVRGARVNGAPDFGMLYRALVDGRNMIDILASKGTEDEAGRIFWALIMILLEVKHRKGKLLEAKYEPSRNVAEAEKSTAKAPQKKRKKNLTDLNSGRGTVSTSSPSYLWIIESDNDNPSDGDYNPRANKAKKTGLQSKAGSRELMNGQGKGKGKGKSKGTSITQVSASASVSTSMSDTQAYQLADKQLTETGNFKKARTPEELRKQCAFVPTNLKSSLE
ncbi:hypothetical protein GYMLUDRAFT_60365 [Collybiopsis luxurians FD-317 M1]|uniref:Uncharacterized protein n=1 Tax=Collybiopsis luxurians FD-317 M1 TaxID=944289 RepID=A0A0D0CKY0_9AGAR|nr:hypothetical protein GYMLUDRAFT_60365 [Collybiopsis luxurians FD-317 M1]